MCRTEPATSWRPWIDVVLEAKATLGLRDTGSAQRPLWALLPLFLWTLTDKTSYCMLRPQSPYIYLHAEDTRTLENGQASVRARTEGPVSFSLRLVPLSLPALKTPGPPNLWAAGHAARGLQGPLWLCPLGLKALALFSNGGIELSGPQKVSPIPPRFLRSLLHS